MNIENTAPFFVDREIIVLCKNGIWLADGTEISHEPTRKLFSKSLQKDSKGYFLKIGSETKYIEVEDTAYFVIRIEGDLHEGYRLFLNDETSEILVPETLQYRPGRLICQIKEGKEEARLLQVPYIELLRNLEEDAGSYYLPMGASGRIQLASKKKIS